MTCISSITILLVIQIREGVLWSHVMLRCSKLAARPLRVSLCSKLAAQAVTVHSMAPRTQLYPAEYFGFILRFDPISRACHVSMQDAAVKTVLPLLASQQCTVASKRGHVA